MILHDRQLEVPTFRTTQNSTYCNWRKKTDIRIGLKIIYTKPISIVIWS